MKQQSKACGGEKRCGGRREREDPTSHLGFRLRWEAADQK